MTYENAGGSVEDNPLHATGPTELWAATEKARIRELTFAELGIADPGPGQPLPTKFIGTRKRVVKNEFSRLSEAERDEWMALARARKEAEELANCEGLVVQECVVCVCYTFINSMKASGRSQRQDLEVHGETDRERRTRKNVCNSVDGILRWRRGSPGSPLSV